MITIRLGMDERDARKLADERVARHAASAHQRVVSTPAEDAILPSISVVSCDARLRAIERPAYEFHWARACLGRRRRQRSLRACADSGAARDRGKSRATPKLSNAARRIQIPMTPDNTLPANGVAAGAPGSGSLGEALPKEIERCQDLLTQYAAIGPAGQFGSMMIKRDIAAALKAVAEGGVVAMIRAYEALKGCKQPRTTLISHFGQRARGQPAALAERLVAGLYHHNRLKIQQMNEAQVEMPRYRSHKEVCGLSRSPLSKSIRMGLQPSRPRRTAMRRFRLIRNSRNGSLPALDLKRLTISGISSSTRTAANCGVRLRPSRTAARESNSMHNKAATRP